MTDKTKKKTYRLPCSWEMYGYLVIEAENLQEAIDIADSPEQGLPEDGNYVDGSFKVDAEMIEAEYPNEDFHI